MTSLLDSERQDHMKKISLFLLIFVFLAVSAFAGELIIGGGFFNMGPGGGGGAEYEMDASGGSIIVNGLTGQSFTYSGTTRTYIDGDGVMQDAAINTPRVEADGLLLEPQGMNVLLQSRNVETTPWTGNSVNAQNETGVDGVANKAWTVTDDQDGLRSRAHLVPSNGQTGTWVASVFVKKTTSASTFPGFGISVGGVGVGYVTIDTDNGTLVNYSGGAPDDSGVIDTGGDWWRVWAAMDATGSTTMGAYFYPAINTDATGTWAAVTEGSCIVDAFQFDPDMLAPSSYIDNDGVAAGSDLATDGDCSGGTLSMGTGWTHDAGNNEYDATASTANLSEGSILTVGKLYRIKTVWGNITGGSVQIRVGGAPVPGLITADGTYYHYAVATSTVFSVDGVTAFTGSLQEYEVLEFGTVRETEAGALTYDLPSDLFAETLGAEQVTNGTFDTDTDWTKGTGWTIASDKATSDGTPANLTSTGDGSEAGKFYKVSFEVTDHTSGSVILSGYSADGSPGLTGVGVWTGYLTANGTFGVRFYSNNFIGSLDNVSIEEVTNAYDSGDGLAPPHGTAIVWWRPGYNKNESGNNYIIRLDNGAFFYHNGNGFPRTSDGVVEIETALTFAKNTDYKIIIKWGYLASNVAKFRIGYDSGSGVSWGTETDFDGGYITGTTLDFATTLNNLHHNKRTQIYEQILSDAEIDATPAP